MFGLAPIWNCFFFNNRLVRVYDESRQYKLIDNFAKFGGVIAPIFGFAPQWQLKKKEFTLI
jgi:hypothetical protein